MKIVVTGGGSGGHIYPALAVVEALNAHRLGVQVKYIGGTQGMEAQLVPAAGLDFVGVTTKKLRKVLSPATLSVVLALWKGYREAADFLRTFKPDVVISTGGYVAAATVLAASRQRIPIVILAPDAVPGRTNLWMARRAARICTLFEETRSQFPESVQGRVVVTGLPIRSGIISSVSRSEAHRSFGLKENVFTLLATGGSQGAQRLNEVVRSARLELQDNVQILHQVGTGKEEVTESLGKGVAPYVAVPFLNAEQMPLAYRASDVTLCRCGVGSLAEAAANGLPLLMVPLPTAYADHQTHNARAYEHGGGGVLIAQAELTPERLVQEVHGLRTDPARREQMAKASRALGRPDAAARVAEIAKDTA